MKLKTLFISTLIGASLLLSSCIKDEGLDREADITSFTIKDKGYLTTIINEASNEVTLMMETDIYDFYDYKNGTIIPIIEVSPGATVSPASWEPVTLNNFRMLYTVTSEDGAQKAYNVTISSYATSSQPLFQDFEEWTTEIKNDGKRVYELLKDPMWVNANTGVDMHYYDNRPFPTRSTTDKYPGAKGNKALVLETVEGKRAGKVGLMDIPVYAGNMYRGIFRIGQVLKDPLSTTLFGQPHPKYMGKPLRLEAYYKYKAGEEYLTYDEGIKDIKTVYEDKTKKDKLDIYAVLYKVEKGEKGREDYLTAHDIKTSNKIIATAFMADQSEKEDWTFLNTPFTYKEEPDFSKYDYKLAVVLSSSENGASYKGAIGSILTVDDLRVVCEIDEQEK